jgi:hypothetical protein
MTTDEMAPTDGEIAALDALRRLITRIDLTDRSLEDLRSITADRDRVAVAICGPRVATGDDEWAGYDEDDPSTYAVLEFRSDEP